MASILIVLYSILGFGVGIHTPRITLLLRKSVPILIVFTVSQLCSSLAFQIHSVLSTVFKRPFIVDNLECQKSSSVTLVMLYTIANVAQEILLKSICTFFYPIPRKLCN